MAMTAEIPQTVSPIDALWAHFVSLQQGVQKEFVNRINFFMENEQPEHTTLSIKEVNDRFNQAEADIKCGNVLSTEEVHHNIESKCAWL